MLRRVIPAVVNFGVEEKDSVDRSSQHPTRTSDLHESGRNLLTSFFFPFHAMIL